MACACDACLVHLAVDQRPLVGLVRPQRHRLAVALGRRHVAHRAEHRLLSQATRLQLQRLLAAGRRLAALLALVQPLERAVAGGCRRGSGRLAPPRPLGGREEQCSLRAAGRASNQLCRRKAPAQAAGHSRPAVGVRLERRECLPDLCGPPWCARCARCPTAPCATQSPAGRLPTWPALRQVSTRYCSARLPANSQVVRIHVLACCTKVLPQRRAHPPATHALALPFDDPPAAAPAACGPSPGWAAAPSSAGGTSVAAPLAPAHPHPPQKADAGQQ